MFPEMFVLFMFLSFLNQVHARDARPSSEGWAARRADALDRRARTVALGSERQQPKAICQTAFRARRNGRRSSAGALTRSSGPSSIVVWAVSGPAFHYSDTWQLIINTGTTIITFLMVFLIQNTQNRDTTAIQLKLDELIRANENAREQMLRLEDLTENQIKHLKESFGTAPSTPFGNRWKQRKRGLQRLPRISRRQKVASPEKARPFGREKMTILHRRAWRLGGTMPPPQAREYGE